MNAIINDRIGLQDLHTGSELLLHAAFIIIFLIISLLYSMPPACRHTVLVWCLHCTHTHGRGGEERGNLSLIRGRREPYCTCWEENRMSYHWHSTSSVALGPWDLCVVAPPSPAAASLGAWWVEVVVKEEGNLPFSVGIPLLNKWNIIIINDNFSVARKDHSHTLLFHCYYSLYMVITFLGSWVVVIELLPRTRYHHPTILRWFPF